MAPTVIKVHLKNCMEDIRCPSSWSVREAIEQIQETFMLQGGQIEDNEGIVDFDTIIGTCTNELFFIDGEPHELPTGAGGVSFPCAICLFYLFFSHRVQWQTKAMPYQRELVMRSNLTAV